MHDTGELGDGGGAARSPQDSIGASYRKALLCGAAPLAAGVATFFLWVLTRWDLLSELGFGIIVGGLWAFGAGSVALYRYLGLALHTLEIPPRRVWCRFLAAAALLLVNFPGCVAIVGAVGAIAAQYTVTIDNRSSHPIEQAKVEGGGITAAYGTVPPGDRAYHTFYFSNWGTLEFSGLYRGRTIKRQIDRRVSKREGGWAEVIVHDDGNVRVVIRYQSKLAVD